MNDIFKARSLSKKCERTYTRQYFPNNSLLDWQDYADTYGLQTFRYQDLKEQEIWGMPYAVTRDEKGQLNVTFQEAAHTLIVGTTQVGKTWGPVMDSIFTLSAKKNKANFMITDPKGEIFENTAQTLKDRGYQIYLLNFKDSSCSNMWNPLLDIYDGWMELYTLEDSLMYHSSTDSLSDFLLEDAPSEFARHGRFWSLDNKAYATRERAVQAMKHKQGEIETRTSDLINQLVASLGNTAVSNSKDPGWQQGALEVLRGMIYLMLEDALDSRSDFRRENMNFMNMQRYYELIRQSVLTGINNTPLLKTRKLMHKKITDDSIRHMRGFFENAPTTARSYLGIFENIMQDWFNPKIYSLTNNNNIDLSHCDQRPVAIFLVTRDYEKSDYFIAGLFIDWVYQQMMTKAEECGGRLPREMFFMLDEFANIPLISGFTSKISTSLSRRIIFQLYIQSYEQLESNYGPADAGTIRANCNAELFLGSQSYRTKKEFSEKCGVRRIRTLDAALTPDRDMFTDIPILSIGNLEDLKRGDAYAKRLNRPTSRTHFEMAFQCPELCQRKMSANELGIQSVPYTDELFVYNYLENDMTMDTYYKIRNIIHSDEECSDVV